MIAAPISYCPDDQALVDAYDGLKEDQRTAAFWSAPPVEALKSRVKTYYIEAQATRCCYCNRHLRSVNHRMWDVEHIAARVHYPQFMFTPVNLAAACPDCNRIKADKYAFSNRRRKTYPKKSSGFRIIHPHFDTFEDHIYNRGLIFIPKTEKGKNTIVDCDLLRFAQHFIDWQNSAVEHTFEREVDVIFDESNMMAQAAVDAIVSNLPEA